MKIAIDCRMSGKSGIGTFLDGIVPYLCDGTNSILLIGFSSLPQYCTSHQCCVCLPCTIKPFSLKEIFFFPKSCLNEINKCDLYFSPYCNVPNGIKIPIYTTIHDIVFLDMKNLAGPLGTSIRKFFYKRAIKKSKALFTVSEFSKSRIQEKLRCTKNIFVVYNGVPKYVEQKITPAPQKTDTILYIGNIKAHKGLSTLLEAFKEFKNSPLFENGHKPSLIIVGSKDNFRTKDSKMVALLENSKTQGIEFTGFVSDEKLHALLSEAKMLVQPSLYEGFGIPPLEALYSGTIPVVSDIPVFKEIYKNFPVVFFHKGDASDLCVKMASVWNNPILNEIIPQRYSYKHTAELVIKQLTVYAE